jgi:hypothetical protein
MGRPERGGAGPPGAGAAGRRGDDRGRGQRPGDREAVPGVADEREPVAAGAGRGRPGGAGFQGRGRREVQALPGPGRRAGGGSGCGPGGGRGMRISARRWRGSRTGLGGGSGWSTRWPGWTCCCTGTAGPCRSRPGGPRSGTRRRLLGSCSRASSPSLASTSHPFSNPHNRSLGRLALVSELRQRDVQFASGGDAKLGEDLAQVPFHRARGQEQLGADFRVGPSVAG